MLFCFAVVAGAIVVCGRGAGAFFCCRCGGAFLFELLLPWRWRALFAVVAHCSLLLSLWGRVFSFSVVALFLLFCCRGVVPVARSVFVVVAGAFSFDVVPVGRCFVCCRSGGRGSLTHWLLGSAHRQQNNNYTQNTGSLLVAPLSHNLHPSWVSSSCYILYG